MVKNWTELDARSNQSFVWNINPTNGGDKYTRPFAISEEDQAGYSIIRSSLRMQARRFTLRNWSCWAANLPEPPREALLAAIQEVEGLTQANYAPESWNALQTVLEVGKDRA